MTARGRLCEFDPALGSPLSPDSVDKPVSETVAVFYKTRLAKGLGSLPTN
jgi:hypothetical protein